MNGTVVCFGHFRWVIAGVGSLWLVLERSQSEVR